MHGGGGVLPLAARVRNTAICWRVTGAAGENVPGAVAGTMPRSTTHPTSAA